MTLMQKLQSLLPKKWDDTDQQIWDAKLEVEIAEARKAAGLVAECSSTLIEMANGAKPPKHTFSQCRSHEAWKGCPFGGLKVDA